MYQIFNSKIKTIQLSKICPDNVENIQLVIFFIKYEPILHVYGSINYNSHKTNFQDL